MKTRFIIKSFIASIMVMFAFSLKAQTTSATVGELNNGKALVTNLSEATRVLKGGLTAAATISNISIEYSEGEKAYFLVGNVSNDPVSGKAVQLYSKGNVLYAAAGPGVEITCHGENCPTCLPDIKNWKPRCKCWETVPGKEAKCDMQSKVVVSF